MSSSIQVEKNYDLGTIVPFAALAVGFLFLALAYLAWTKRFQIWGTWVRWNRQMRGLPVAKDRVHRNYYVLIDPGQGPGRVIRTTTVNVSPNGMFVKTHDPLEQHQAFSYKMELTDFRMGISRTLRGRAEVRWVRKSWPRGMGCEFIDLEEAEKNRLRSFLQQRKK